MQPVLLALFILAVLYFPARYIRPWGEFVSFYVGIAGKILHAVDTFLSDFDRKPQYPAFAVEDRPGLTLITLLLFFDLGGVVVSADLYHAWLASPLFTGTNAEQLPILHGVLSVSSAALFFSPVALCSMVCLSVCGYIPPKHSLFPDVKSYGKWFKRLLFGTLAVTLLTCMSFFFLRAFYLADPLSDATTVTRLVTFGLLGLAIPFSAYLAIEAVRVGATSVVFILSWIVFFIVRLASLVVSTAASLCDFVCGYFTAGTMSIHDTFQQNTNSVSAASSKDVVHHDPLAVVEQKEVTEQKELEVSISMSEAQASMVFVGFDGTRNLVPVSANSVHLGAQNVISSHAVVYRGSSHVRKAWGLGVDMTPSQNGITGNIADVQAYQLLFERLEANQVSRHKPFDAFPSPVFYFLDSRIGYTAEAYLRNIHRRLPSSSLALVTLVSPADLDDVDAQKTISMAHKLYQEQVIATTFVLDPQSPFGVLHGENKLIEFAARTMISLLLGHKHHPDNRSCVEVLERLQSLSAFVSMSFCIVDVIPGATPRRGFFLKWFSNKAVVGDVKDMREQALHATDEVMSGQDCLAGCAALDPSKLVFLVNNFPLRLDEARFSEAAILHTHAAHKKYPNTTGINVRASGLSYTRESLTPFRVGVTGIYALPDDWFSPTVEQMAQPDTTQKMRTAGANVKPDTDTVVIVPAVPAAAAPEQKKIEPEKLETPPPVRKKAGNGRGRPTKAGK